MVFNHADVGHALAKRFVASPQHLPWWAALVFLADGIIFIPLLVLVSRIP